MVNGGRRKKLRRGNESVAKISSFFPLVAVSTEHEMPNLLFHTEKSLNITARPLGLVIIMSKSKPQWTAQYFLQSSTKSWKQKFLSYYCIHTLCTIVEHYGMVCGLCNITTEAARSFSLCLTLSNFDSQCYLLCGRTQYGWQN